MSPYDIPPKLKSIIQGMYFFLSSYPECQAHQTIVRQELEISREGESWKGKLVLEKISKEHGKNAGTTWVQLRVGGYIK